MSFDLGDYVDVAERISKFYERHPDGRIVATPPAVIELGDRVFLSVTASVFRSPDDPTPSVGTAWEPWPGRTPYTKDSEAMNAETSAVGRALALAGIEVRRSIASRDEVAHRRDTSDDPAPDRPVVPPADQARARVTFDRLKLAKGTAIAADVRALADAHGKRLTLAALATDPAWRAMVDELLDQNTAQPEPGTDFAQGSEVEPPAPSTGGRARADGTVLAQIRDAATRLELSDDDVAGVASALLGREIENVEALTKSAAARVLAELLGQLADFVPADAS